MEELLAALGCKTTVLQRQRLSGLFAAVTFGFLVAI
jgi:hypothetical protein